MLTEKVGGAISANRGQKGKLIIGSLYQQDIILKKIPGNVCYIPRVRYRMPESENHPTQKPEASLT